MTNNCTRLHCITSQKTVIFVVTAAESCNIIMVLCVVDFDDGRVVEVVQYHGKWQALVLITLNFRFCYHSEPHSLRIFLM
jgi:hypothetical protein